MDSERPHRASNSNNSTSELFICFTSRLSSSSMKLSSKSLLSPSRSREPSHISLSTSLSRRLRNNSSIKGGQASPMFPTAGKKRGTFENPEPSSPKVTCIGQVRVKTKKQGKKIRTRSMRRGEASFRRTEQSFQVSANANPDLSQQSSQSFQLQNLKGECSPHRNQRWVHLPVTIYEALRAVGAEFSCLFPCRSSCMSNEREKEEEARRTVGSGDSHGRESSCGEAVARWLVALQEGEEEARGREIEMVVGEEDRRDRPERSQRRHVFEDLDINIDNNKNEGLSGEEEKARVSICIPPKNALLLMRCRSDPVKMAALANRFWEPPVQKEEIDEEDDNNRDDEEEQEREEKQVHMEEDEELLEKIEVATEEVAVNSTICEVEQEPMAELEGCDIENRESIEEPVVEGEGCDTENGESIEINRDSELNQEKLEAEDEGDDSESNVNEEDETLLNISSPETALDLEKPELQEVQQDGQERLEEKETNDKYYNEETSLELASSSVVSEALSDSEGNDAAATMAEMAETENPAETVAESTEEEEKETAEKAWEEEETATRDGFKSDSDDPNLAVGPESKERESYLLKTEKKSPVLPECLLLMMCEPKLSMEVSKETWVCSTDFVRWLPERRPKKKDGGDELKKRISNESKLPPPPPQLLQPPRSSCSFPVAPGGGMSMASMIEQKLVGSNGYEPFVLTRCKSEPMRSSAKFAPDACFWKNRKLEPHRPATVGAVGAAGVGF